MVKLHYFRKFARGGFVFILLFLAGCGGFDASPSVSEERAPLPEIKLLSVLDADKPVKQGLGTVTVVNLWATWCPPCVEEMDEFARFYLETSREAVTLVMFSADGEKALKSAVMPFVAKKQLPFPVFVLDQADPDILSKVLGTPLSGGLPVTLIYDTEGRRVKSWERAVTFEELTAAVKPYLK